MTSTPRGSAGPTSNWQRLRRVIEAPLASRRVQSEAFWVAVAKGVDLPLTFLSVKLYTGLLPKSDWGQYSLAATGVLLLANILLAPFQQALRREFYALQSQGRLRAALELVLKMQTVVCLAVPIAAIAAAAPLARGLQVDPWVVIGTGLMFLGHRWRLLHLELLEVRRERRAVAQLFLTFRFLQVAAVTAVAWGWSATAAAAILADAVVAVFFAGWDWRSLWRYARAQGGEPSPAERRAIWRDLWGWIGSFGLPSALVLMVAWLQTFADRYVVAQRISLAEAGVYATAFMLTGAPFVIALQFLSQLLVPVAYARAAQRDDPRGLWRADQVVLGGAAVFVAGGLAVLPAYFFFGPWLLAAISTPEYQMPAAALTLLAAGRLLSHLGQWFEVTFGVHRAVLNSLAFRVFSAALMLPGVWLLTGQFGVLGAAWGVLGGAAAYLAAVLLGPGGAIWLMRSARGGAAPPVGAAEPDESPTGGGVV